MEELHQQILYYLNEAKNRDFLYFKTAKEALAFALSCIDLTSLEGADTNAKIIDLCDKASNYFVPETAAVCVYPVFVKLAKKRLSNSNVKVACVAGGFPAGQIPLAIKLQEVQYAIEQGANEIDIVISRGKFLEGKHAFVFDEINAIKSICKDVVLKVILETGELGVPYNILKASETAIEAGADFIKTSTGKIAINATPEAFITMLLTIKSHYEKTGKQIGIKPAGGITDIETTLLYIKLLEGILGKRWLHKTYFRIGASRLADKLFKSLSE
ncbi:MAG: deoxyribose-phosphate aldolase [Bacteroidales bacterium]|jgi:deoxyribose-phosphate aldolase|nr:deoxyribose-phosphate aldolase [Bacteroidales bacterium]